MEAWRKKEDVSNEPKRYVGMYHNKKNESIIDIMAHVDDASLSDTTAPLHLGSTMNVRTINDSIITSSWLTLPRQTPPPLFISGVQ